MTRQVPEPLTSAANPRIRAALDLRGRRGRDRTGSLLVDGWREVARALDGGVEIVEAFVDAAGARDEGGAATVARLAELRIDVVQVAGPALARLAYGERSSDVVAVARAPDTSLLRLRGLVARVADPLVVVVEDAEKPGNLGAIARSADGAGATALVAATGRGPTADPWNANAVRASLGTVFTLPIAVAATDDVLAWLREAGIRIVAARVQATSTYHETNLRGAVAIALGSEAHGLGPGWLASDIAGVRLPMRGRADSLNVAAAASILLYEARRQRDVAAAGKDR